MLTRNESRQLRGVAELLRGQPSPAMLEQIAAMLETFAEDGTKPPHADERQCDLPLASSSSSAVTSTASTASHVEVGVPPSHVVDATSLSYESPPAPPSSSSDQDLSEEKQKTEKRWRPHTDEALPADFRLAYEDVLAERRRSQRAEIQLPSAEFLWGKFVEHLWERDKSYASKWALKRRWREWVWHENHVPSSQDAQDARPPASVTAFRVVGPPAAAESATPMDREAYAAASASLANFAGPPEPRSMSA